MDNSLKHTQFDLENPKNALQYQCYKTSLSIQMLFDNLTPAIKQLTTVLSEFAQKLTAAEHYPRIAHLASHAKKRRVRLKNLRRLQKLGQKLR